MVRIGKGGSDFPYIYHPSDFFLFSRYAPWKFLLYFSMYRRVRAMPPVPKLGATSDG